MNIFMIFNIETPEIFMLDVLLLNQEFLLIFKNFLF